MIFEAPANAGASFGNGGTPLDLPEHPRELLSKIAEYWIVRHHGESARGVKHAGGVHHGSGSQRSRLDVTRCLHR